MAEFKTSIQLGVKIPKTADVQKELDELIKQLNKNSKINLDVKIDKNILGTLEKLSAELKNINSASFSNVDKSLKNVANAIQETDKKAEHLKTTLNADEFQSASMSATKSFDNVSQKVDEVNKKVEQANKNLKNNSAEIGAGIKKTGESLSSVGDALTTKVTAPLALIGGVAAKVGMDFDSQMSRVKAISGATGEEFGKLHDQALQLGADTAFSAKQAAEGMENLASAGFSTNEIMEAMPGLLNLAASSGESLASSSDIAASTLRGFGLEASQAGHVADVLAKNASATNAAVSDTGEAMKYIAPVAHSMGLSLEEVTASIGEMANAGIKGSQAGTTLRSALTKLASPSKESADAMSAIGFTAFDSQGKLLSLSGIINNLSKSLKGKTDQQKEDYIATIFGQEAMSGMLTLIENGSSALDDLTNNYKTADGAASDMAKTMQDNAKSAIEQMTGSLETAAIKLEEAVAPSITNVANEVMDLANKFSELPEPVQQTIIDTALFAATIGPVTKILGTVTSGIGTLVTFGGRLASTFGLLGEGASIGGTALTAFSTAGLGAVGVASALVAGVAGVITYQELLERSVSTSTDELTTWEKVVNSLTGNVIKSKSELVKAGLVYKDFGEGVSDSFKDGIEKATKEFHEFEMTLTGANSGEKITDEGSKKIQSAINSMIDGAKATVNKRKSEVQTELSKMFNSKDGIDSGEQAVLDEANKASDEKLSKINEIQKQISDVWTKAIQEHGKLSQEDVAQIENYLQQVKQIQAEVSAKNTAESDFAKNQFSERLKGISAEDASKQYQEASQELSKNFADARATYKTGMDDMQKMIDDYNSKGQTAEAQNAQKVLSDKKKEYDDLINTEKTKRREYLDMLYEKNPSLQGNLNEVDGTTFSKVDRNTQGDLYKLKQQYSEIAEATESGMKRVKDANGQWHDIQVQVDSATGQITSAYDTMTGKFGGYSEKFANDAKVSGDKIKESMENLQKSLMPSGGGLKIDIDNNAINASTDEVIGKLQTVIEKADGTKTAIQDINGTQVKLEFDKDGALKNINDVTDAINGKITDNPAVVNVDVNDQDALNKFKETENASNEIPKETNTDVNVDNADANSKVEDTSQKLDTLDNQQAEPKVNINAGNSLSIIDRIKNFFAWLTDRNATATVNVNQTGSANVGHNAKGTDNWRGGLTYINEDEEGELVNLPNGTQIIPHDLSEKIIEEEAKNSNKGNITVNNIDVYQGKENETSTLDINKADTIDKPYTPEVDTSSMSESEKKAYEEKKKAQENEEKRLKDLTDKEKQYLDDIGSAWDSNSKATQQSIKELELKEDEYGKNITVSQKLDILNQKYQKEVDLLPEAERQLNTYKNTSVTTAEAQEELNKKIQEATDTVIEQKKAIIDAYNEMKEYQEQLVSDMREELVGYYLKQQQDKVNDLEEKAQKAEEKAEKALEKQKQAKLDYWDAQIKSKQAELDALNDSSEENENKLKKLQAELALWQKDDSTFSKSKIVQLTSQIAETQKELKQNQLQKEINALNDSKQADSDYYSQKLTDLQESNNQQEEENQKNYKKMLDEKKAYQKVDEMITNNNEKAMVKLYKSYGDSYKEIGSLYGENITNAFKEKVAVMESIVQDMAKKISNALDVDVDVKSSSGSSSSSSSSSSHSKDYDNGDYEDSNGYYYSVNGTSGKPNQTYSNGDYTDSNGWYHVASYDTGGRTPSNIDDGAVGILHSDEKILNKEDTVKFDNAMDKINDMSLNSIDNAQIDQIYDYMKSAGSILNNLSNYNLSNYSIPINTGLDLNRIANSVTTNNNSTDNNYEPNITVNASITNNTPVDAMMNERNFEKMMNRVLQKSSRKYGGKSLGGNWL